MDSKILLVGNTGWYLYNFRLPLAKTLRDRGVEVVMVSPRDTYVERMQAEGFRWIELKMDRINLNPIHETAVIQRMAAIYRREKPSVVHHFTAKCVLYGTLAARMADVPGVVNAITGLGTIYVGRSWKAKALRLFVSGLYRRTLTAHRVRVIFQNPDDMEAFAKAGLIHPRKTKLIRSSGVNMDRFKPTPESQRAVSETRPPIVFCAARLTHSKGIHEYVEAARILKGRGVSARFQLAGDIDPGNPSPISQESLDAWKAEGVIEHLGHVDGMESYLSQAAIVALASYSEGVPRTLVEAAAMAKPIVTTDAPGCKEIVDPGVNGLRAPVRDSAAFADALETLLRDPALRVRMGEAGRKKAIAEFDERDVIRRTIDVYVELGAMRRTDLALAQKGPGGKTAVSG